MEIELGTRLRAYRVNCCGLDQATVAERSGISVRTLRNLEMGNGSSLHTLICVLRTLGLEDCLDTIAPTGVHPLVRTRHKRPRQRVSKLRRTLED
ncbi:MULTISPECIES: helix-turn-helix transcriptional regulator [unclassified Cupriavidus]|uniref:helix-turn-helix transcriptional regulator n=1 Tax=unclassified Cupriavidus TaxID=2640874 RepID=UPI001FD7B85F|nr:MULTISPECIES: helix-turn-helix transcriptional regulator [unclassified Cupriavidus]